MRILSLDLPFGSPPPSLPRGRLSISFHLTSSARFSFIPAISPQSGIGRGRRRARRGAVQGQGENDARRVRIPDEGGVGMPGEGRIAVPRSEARKRPPRERQRNAEGKIGAGGVDAESDGREGGEVAEVHREDGEAAGEVGDECQGRQPDVVIGRPGESFAIVVVVVVVVSRQRPRQRQGGMQGRRGTEPRERGGNQRRRRGGSPLLRGWRHGPLRRRQGRQGRQAVERSADGSGRGGKVAQSLPLGGGGVADRRVRVPADAVFVGRRRREGGSRRGAEGGGRFGQC